ncbi:MAG TPA: DUF523 and DUF1722 domain-containing protein [Vicinamibacterales bacterium]|nr:DUF523 and DUF1722 domain-containing protein [Vicinamibacterales bacterium]
MSRVSRIRIGISACLLGEEVRFDGGHKRDAFLTTVLGPHVEWVPVCPEVEMGLGTPRETLRLARSDGRLRMVTTRSGIDHTDAMNRWASRRAQALEREDLCGYVLKKDSPSCGMERVKVYPEGGVPERSGRGLFAEALIARLPSLPVEEEGRLSDPRLRENFIERVFACRRLKDLFTGRWSYGALVRFHTAHKMALLAHSTTRYNELGRLVATGRSRSRQALRDEYERGFMGTLALVATRKRQANVLAHMAGHLKRRLDEGSRAELQGAIDDFRRGLVPILVPLTLLRHHVRVQDVAYLAGQTFLEPHPRELMLRNHV